MTKKDLVLIYKGETGKDAPEIEPWIHILDEDEVLEYIKWLEDKLINLYNV